MGCISSPHGPPKFFATLKIVATVFLEPFMYQQERDICTYFTVSGGKHAYYALFRGLFVGMVIDMRLQRAKTAFSLWKYLRSQTRLTLQSGRIPLTGVVLHKGCFPCAFTAFYHTLPPSCFTIIQNPFIVVRDTVRYQRKLLLSGGFGGDGIKTSCCDWEVGKTEKLHINTAWLSGAIQETRQPSFLL